jgi:hypothetical protein
LPAATLLGPPGAFADQNAAEVVYVTDSSGNQIFKVDFAAGTTTQVNTDSAQHTQFTSLAVRDTGLDQVDLLATDANTDKGCGAGGVFFYAGAAGNGQLVTSQVRVPDGLSLDLAKNAYLVNGAPGSGCPSVRQVWKIPFTGCSGDACAGGYPLNGAQLIDKAVPGELLSDTRIVSFAKGPLTVGDLLVLSRKPARLWLYPGAAPCTQLEACAAQERVELLDQKRFPKGAEPTGLVFDPDGNLLILTLGGDVLRYDPGADAFLANFASGVGNGATRIAVGVQTVGGKLKSRAFVTVKGAPQAVAFNIANGLGVLDGTVTQNLSVPTGVGLGTGKFLPTPAGKGTKIDLETVESTFDDVRGSGLTGMNCFERPDPRCTNPKDPFDCGEGGLDAHDLVPSLPHIIIPSYVRGFQKSLALGAPPSGPAILRICRAATNADIFRTIEQHESEHLWLLNRPDCDDKILRGQPRVFWGPAPGEPPIVERSGDFPVMIDVSTRCHNGESDRGVTPDYSIFLGAVGDTRGLNEIVRDKIARLGETLDVLNDFIDGSVAGQLEDALGSAGSAFASGDLNGTVAALNSFIAIIDANAPEPAAGECQAGAFDNCDRNVSGELLARAISTRFIACKIDLVDGCPTP